MTTVVTAVELWPTHSVSLTLQSDANGGIVFENEPDESIVLELLPFHRGADGQGIDNFGDLSLYWLTKISQV